MKVWSLLWVWGCLCLSSPVSGTGSERSQLVPHVKLVPEPRIGEAKPVQIVKPDGKGGLEVVESGLKFLSSLPGGFEVVGVLGTFHTGKSFLLNQLMGRMGGFETGPTVHPTTEGLWVWGVPLSDGADMQVLLLDTEGLAAPGNTNDYDAKIFAVATLLSTHILYNSVKIVDQQSLDYLQILARRAQLFALKSLLVDGGTNIESMIRFPPLTWVVEDFFQDMINNETPTQWLHRLMREQNEAESSKANFTPGLASIFPEAHCQTVFMPAHGREALKRLDRLDPSELTPEYQADIKALAAHIITSLREQRARRHEQLCLPSTELGAPTGGQCLSTVRNANSGPTLAALVRLVVKASNEGTLSKMPDVWELFMKDQADDAKTSAMTVFSKTVAALAEGGVPVTMEEYNEKLTIAKSRALSVFHQALFGLQHNYMKSMQDDLLRTLKVEEGHAQREHQEAIRKYIQRIVQKEHAQFNRSLASLSLPMTAAALTTQMDSLRNQAFVETGTVLTRYHDVEESRRIEELISASYARKQTANSESQLRVLEVAQEEAKKEYDRQLGRSVVEKSPLETTALNNLHEAAKGDALRVWSLRTDAISGEKNFKAYEGHLKNDLTVLHEKFVQLNDKHVGTMCDGMVNHLDMSLKKRLASLELPMLLKTLQMTGVTLKNEAIKEFEDGLSKFSKSSAFSRCSKNLQDVITTHIKDFTEDNTRKTRKLVQAPLEAAKELVVAQSNQYYRVSSWRKMASEIAEKKIGDNIKSQELRDMVIEQWLSGTGPNDVGQYAPHSWITWVLSWFFFW